MRHRWGGAVADGLLFGLSIYSTTLEMIIQQQKNTWNKYCSIMARQTWTAQLSRQQLKGLEHEDYKVRT